MPNGKHKKILDTIQSAKDLEKKIQNEFIEIGEDAEENMEEIYNNLFELRSRINKLLSRLAKHYLNK